VLKAIGETWYNLAKMLEDSARKVKLRPKPVGAAIAVEMQAMENSDEGSWPLPERSRAAN